MQNDRKTWGSDAHESKVEGLYGRGVENFGEYHDGYLNFGLWDEGVTDYVAAAENLVRTLGAKAGFTSESRVMDVACGMGTQDVFLVKTFGCEIDAVDITWKHVERARRRAAEAGLSDRIRVHHESGTKVPFPDATFTHVLCVEGAEHIDTREAFMREAFRVLKPGGVLMLADYTITRPMRNGFERSVLWLTCAAWAVPKPNVQTGAELQRTIESIGFKNVTVEYVGAKTIPGYCIEACKPENVREQVKIRGRFAVRIWNLVDRLLLYIFKKGLVEYVLVRAEKE